MNIVFLEVIQDHRVAESGRYGVPVRSAVCLCPSAGQYSNYPEVPTSAYSINGL
jgi:hypothetical protein